jgi:predicted  nucleic acid-binding Zn-ribbon protein
MSLRTTQIVAVVAVLLGVAGVAVGVSAKTGAKSDEEIVDSVKGELSAELGTTKKQESTAQARTNARLTALEKEFASLSGQTKALRTRLDALSAQGNKLSSDLSADVTRLDSRITELSTRIDNLNKSSSGP